MKIWTIKEGEPLPIPECPGRQMRCGILSEMLAERGHDVTWWTSDFFHQTKKRLRDQETVIDLSDHCRLHMLHAKTVYSKNVSLERIRYSRQLGKEFRRAARQAEKPDVIVCSYPLIDLAYEAVSYGKEFHVPVIVDIRDLWPDNMWERFRAPVSGIVKTLCSAMAKRAEFIMRNAAVLIGVTPACLEFAKRYGRVSGPHDDVYYLAYKETRFSDDEIAEAKGFWEQKKLSKDDFIVCYFGNITAERTDFCMVADVIANQPDAKLVMCGDGPYKEALEEEYKDKPNIFFTGYINHVYLTELMRMASIGVVPILSTPDFINTINNKAIEYMAGSLCVGTMLAGLQKHIVEENELGFFYESREELAAWIEKLIHDPELLQRIKANSRQYYEEHFRSQTVYGKLCAVVEELGSSDGEHQQIIPE